MYKLLPIFLFAFCFAETVEVYYTTETPIAGFQFNVDGVSVTNISSGDAEKYNFMISANETTVVGFSLTGSTIPAVRYTLVELEVSSINDAYSICIHDIIVSDPDGNAIDYEIGECWVP